MRYGINGIPTLVVVDKQGIMITFEARRDIQKAPDECLKKWEDESKQHQ